jgi:hypothetical protein
MTGNRTVLCLIFSALALVAASAAANAQQAGALAHEKDVGELRVGQRVLVDDGTCPAGHIKEVRGTTLNQGGVVRTRKCVARAGKR